MPRRKKDPTTSDIPRNVAVNGAEPAETAPVPTPQAEKPGSPVADDAEQAPDRASGPAGRRRKPIRPPRHARPEVPFESRPDAPFDLDFDPQAGRERVAAAPPVAEDRVSLPVIPL